MSAQEYEVRGYGIQFDKHCGSNTTVDRIQAMLALAPEFKKRVDDYVDGFGLKPCELSVEEYEQFDEDYQCGIPALIAGVINEYYNSNFVEAGLDDAGVLYLYIPQILPWQCDDFMKNLSECDACDILRKFYHMLYDNDVTLDNVSIRTFG